MKDLTLKFHDKLQFKAFLSSLDWEEDEDLQNKLLVDEIGFTYTETGVTEEGEPVCVRNDGYFVNISILDDLFDVSVFSDYVVELETPLREWSRKEEIMDISPLLHALCAVAAQILVGLFTGNWAYGAIAGCTFFIAREHTQAEYRWIEMFGHGKRINMPWWGGFDPRAWDVASLMDFAVPVVACLLVWLLVNRG